MFEPPTEPTKPYDGNCHCGAVKYTVNIAPLDAQKVTRCNCSICLKNGYLLVYPPRKDVTFHQGFDLLKSYQFGKNYVEHKFCPTCGSSVLIEISFKGKEGYAMNVRMFKDIKLDTLEYRDVDGWGAADPQYTV